MNKIILLCLIIPLFLNARSWQEIKESGVLKAGVRDSTLLVYRPNDIKNPGFTYEMLKDFADFHKLKLELKIVPKFVEYWKKDGINLNKTKEIATPDIYDHIDLAAEIFTITNRRKELLNLIPYIDNVELFFGAKNDNSRKLEDLIGKSIITYEAMIFSKILKKELKKKNIPFTTKYLNLKDGNIITPKRSDLDENLVNIFLVPLNIKERRFAYKPVAKSQIEVGINDGIAVILKIFENSYYREKLKPLFPIQEKKSQLAWASEYKNKELNKKLKEFFLYDKKTGNFSKRLKKYIGMSEEEYNKLVNMIN